MLRNRSERRSRVKDGASYTYFLRGSVSVAHSRIAQ
jgi:hypothetical protein